MKKSILYLIFVVLFGVFLSVSTEVLSYSARAADIKTDLMLSAKSALLVDAETGTIVFEKNANDRLPIASMTKLATLAIVFDAIEKNIIKPTSDVVVSKNAASIGGSSAFLDAGSTYKLEDLIKSVVIASANDSSVAIAEFVSGNENAFVSRMNKMAENLKLENTNFENCTGLPAKNHYSSAFDMIQIYKQVCDNKLYQKYAKIWMDDFMHPSGRRTELVNTNRLIKTYEGIVGGKTGYTDSAKFCLTASAKRGNLSLIGVVIGADDSKTRFSEMSKLFDYGFSNYKTEQLINSEVPVGFIKPKNAINMTNVFPKNNVFKFMKKDDQTKFSTDYQLYELKAPICAGSEVGKMFVFDENNMVVEEVSLIISEDIKEIDFDYMFNRIVKIW